MGDDITFDEKAMAIVKTTEDKMNDVLQAISEQDGTGEPEVIALPIMGASGQLMEWLNQ